MKTTFKILLPAIGLVASATVLASGGGGFSAGGSSSQRVDQQYELGKNYYKSSQANGSRLEYCVKDNKGIKKLSRRSVKQFKKGSVDKFVDSLYNCAAPDQKIADVVSDEQGTAILYYLNKRFKLRLSNS